MCIPLAQTSPDTRCSPGGPQQSRVTVAILQHIAECGVDVQFLSRLRIAAQQRLNLTHALVHDHDGCCCCLRLSVHTVHLRIAKHESELQVNGLIVQRRHLQEVPFHSAGSLLHEKFDQGGLNRNLGWPENKLDWYLVVRIEGSTRGAQKDSIARESRSGDPEREDPRETRRAVGLARCSRQLAQKSPAPWLAHETKSS